MRSFLRNLFRGPRTIKATRPAPRRVNLQVECLEDRLVPTAVALASLSGSILTINNIAPGHTIELKSNGDRGLEIFDIFKTSQEINPKNLFNISNITKVNIQVTADNVVDIDDSNGMPFAQNATVALSGSGRGNELALGGSRGISGNETYVAGGASTAGGEVLVDNISFQLTSAITSVVDFFTITGTDDVQTSGTNVVTSSESGTLSGLGLGAGGTLTLANKPALQLEEYAVNAAIHLTNVLPLAAFFGVNMHGAGDSTIIATTPLGQVTEVQTDVAPVANPASVTLEANAGPVIVNGNSSTQMTIGQKLSNGLSSTKGIQGNVTVQGLASLSVLDNGNASTAQNVTVTEKRISGTGLFGNNNVVLSYGSVANLSIATGQLADQYTVESSQPNASFTSKISITDFSSTSFRADVFVDYLSWLNLSMFNASPLSAAELFIHPESGLTVTDPGPPQGVVDVVWASDLMSGQVFYDGFTPVVVPG